MFDFGCADGGACDGGGDGGAGGAAGTATNCDMDYTAGYGQFQFGYNESAADVDVTGVDVQYPELQHCHESTDVASYFDSWYSSSTAGDVWWRKIVIPIMCGVIIVFILVFSFKVTKGSKAK